MMTATTLRRSVSAELKHHEAVVLPEGPVADVTSLDIDGLIARNDGGNRSYRRGLALEHIWMNDHDCGIQCK